MSLSKKEKTEKMGMQDIRAKKKKKEKNRLLQEAGSGYKSTCSAALVIAFGDDGNDGSSSVAFN